MARTNFNNPRWVAPLALVAALTSLSTSYYLRNSEVWMPLFYLCFGVLCLLAMFDGLLAYMRLSGEQLEFRSNFRRTVIEKANIDRATWETGSGVSVQLKDGSWVALPSFFHDSLGVTNSIRAWLKKA